MAAVAVMDQLRATNSFIDRHKPWLLARRPHDEDASAWLRVVLGVSIDTVRRAVILLQPFVPDTARRALDRLGVPEQQRCWAHASELLYTSDHSLGGDTTPIFKRLDVSGADDSKQSGHETVKAF